MKGPQIFITDDCDAEKMLSDIWPATDQVLYLCIFHYLQCWRDGYGIPSMVLIKQIGSQLYTSFKVYVHKE